jgi:hypothetical protein
MYYYFVREGIVAIDDLVRKQIDDIVRKHFHLTLPKLMYYNGI